jgi:WD40 repeat protein
MRWADNQLGINPGQPAGLLTDLQPVTALALSADGSFLAVGEASRVRVHPISADGATVSPASSTATMTNVGACALSPDGRWLAVGSPSPVHAQVWDTRNASQVAAFPAASAAHNWHPVFSSDGRWLAVSGRTSQLFAAGTWEPGPALDLPSNGTDHFGAAFYCPKQQPDHSLLAVVAGDREIHLFRLLAGPPATSERLAVLRLPGEPFVSLPAFDDRGNLTVALPRARLATVSLSLLHMELRALDLQW